MVRTVRPRARKGMGRHYLRPDPRVAMTSRTVTTRIATLVKTPDRVVEQHLTPGEVLDVAGLDELREARRALCPEGGCGVLSVIPYGVLTGPVAGDDDQFMGEHGKGAIKALAIVAEDEKVEATVKVYFAFHPTPFPAKVFADEEPARAWLMEQLQVQDADPAVEGLHEPLWPAG